MSTENDKAHEMINELLNLDTGLTVWELEFLDSLSYQAEKFEQDNEGRSIKLSPKQCAKIKGIWNQHH